MKTFTALRTGPSVAAVRAAPPPRRRSSLAVSASVDAAAVAQAAHLAHGLAQRAQPVISAGYTGFCVYFSLNYMYYRGVRKRVEKKRHGEDEIDED